MNLSQFVALLSGAALFLFGMKLMGEGLKQLSGSRLEPVLFRLSGTPLRGILLGAGVTVVIQSSSATSVMAVGFVNAGLMQVRQSIAVILGAILGTSITGWLVCLNYLDGADGITGLLSAELLTGLVSVSGILLSMFSKRDKNRQLGNIMLGFSVLMFGMTAMSRAVSDLGREAWFTALLTSLTHPLLGIVLGAAFAAVLQSASAAVGILQALSVTGAITLEAALPLLMGITIGASLPVLLSALGANVKGKRSAVSYFLASASGVMLCASLFYTADAIVHFDFLSQPQTPFSLALVNTLLRLAIVCLLAPFTDGLEACAALLLPEKADTASAEPPQLEERFLAHPALAIEQCRIAISDMAVQAQEAIETATALLTRYHEAGQARVQALEAAGDRYEDALGSYLVKLTGRELSTRQSREASKFLHTLSDWERLTDHARNIAQSAQEMQIKNIRFSDEAQLELTVLTAAVREAVAIASSAFSSNDPGEAVRVEPLEEVIDDLCDDLKLRHIERLQNGQCTIGYGFVFNDLITNYERISDHCSNIAVALIELNSGTFDTHEYLGNVKTRNSREYEENLALFRRRFAI